MFNPNTVASAASTSSVQAADAATQRDAPAHPESAAISADLRLALREALLAAKRPDTACGFSLDLSHASPRELAALPAPARDRLERDIAPRVTHLALPERMPTLPAWIGRFQNLMALSMPEFEGAPQDLSRLKKLDAVHLGSVARADPHRPAHAWGGTVRATALPMRPMLPLPATDRADATAVVCAYQAGVKAATLAGLPGDAHALILAKLLAPNDDATPVAACLIDVEHFRATGTAVEQSTAHALAPKNAPPTAAEALGRASWPMLMHLLAIHRDDAALGRALAQRLRENGGVIEIPLHALDALDTPTARRIPAALIAAQAELRSLTLTTGEQAYSEARAIRADTLHALLGRLSTASGFAPPLFDAPNAGPHDGITIRLTSNVDARPSPRLGKRKHPDGDDGFNGLPKVVELHVVALSEPAWKDDLCRPTDRLHRSVRRLKLNTGGVVSTRRLGRFQALEELRFTDRRRGPSDAELLRPFEDCRGLKQLELTTSNGLHRDAMSTIGTFTRLERVKLQTEEFDAEDAAALIGLSSLRELDIATSNKFEGPLDMLFVDKPHLTRLALNGAYYANGDAAEFDDGRLFEAIKALPRLRALDLSRPEDQEYRHEQGSPSAIRQLPALEHLIELDLSNRPMDDRTFATIGERFPHLASLSVGPYFQDDVHRVRVAELAHFARFGKLERLELASVSLGPAGFHALARHAPQLRSFSCTNDPHLDAACFAHLAMFEQLEELQLEFCLGVTDACVDALHGLPALKKLVLVDCGTIGDAHPQLHALRNKGVDVTCEIFGSIDAEMAYSGSEYDEPQHDEPQHDGPV